MHLRRVRKSWLIICLVLAFWCDCSSREKKKKAFNFAALIFSDSSRCATASFTANFAHKYFRRFIQRRRFCNFAMTSACNFTRECSYNFKWARFPYDFFQNCARSRFFFRFPSIKGDGWKILLKDVLLSRGFIAKIASSLSVRNLLRSVVYSEGHRPSRQFHQLRSDRVAIGKSTDRRQASRSARHEANPYTGRPSSPHSS